LADKVYYDSKDPSILSEEFIYNSIIYLIRRCQSGQKFIKSLMNAALGLTSFLNGSFYGDISLCKILYYFSFTFIILKEALH